MPTNIGKFLNELVEAFVFYAYQHIETCYVVIRYPMRGPRILAFRQLRAPNRFANPHSFCLLNIFAAYVFLNYFLRYVFTSVGYALRQISLEMEIYGAPDVAIIPLLIMSLLVLISFDAVFRLFFLTVERRPRQRTFNINSILYAFGVQPLSLVVVATYAWQFNLLSSRYETLIPVTCLVLLLGLAVPAVGYCASVVDRYLTWLMRKRIASVFSAFCAGIIYFGAIAEAVVLAKWRLLQGGSVRIENLQCQLAAGRGIIGVIIENRTGRRIILPLFEAFNMSAIYDDKSEVQMTAKSIEASFGNAPFLLLESDRPVWVKIGVDVMVPEGKRLEECFFSIRDRAMSLADKRASWR